MQIVLLILVVAGLYLGVRNRFGKSNSENDKSPVRIKETEIKEEPIPDSYIKMISSLENLCEVAIGDFQNKINQKDYISKSYGEYWRNAHANLHNDIVKIDYQKASRVSVEAVTWFKNFRYLYKNIIKVIEEWNEKYTEMMLVEYQELFDNVEGKSLDKKQREAAICNEESLLVNAGAGSGKTLMLLGKILYLKERYGATDGEILVLMFNGNVKKEFQSRVNKIEEIDVNVDVFTFHGLGNRLMSEMNGYRRNADNQLIGGIYDTYFAELNTKPHRVKQLAKLLSSYLNPYVDSNEEKYKDDPALLKRDDKNAKKITLKGERVSSQEERMIADYLFLKGVKYLTNKPYLGSDNVGHKVYEPDFQFPEVEGLYLEHFGLIDRDGNVPPFFSKGSYKSAKEKYNTERLLKIQKHRDNGTTLIETYSYEFSENTVYDKLDYFIRKYNIPTKPMTSDEILEYFRCNHKDKMDNLKSLITRTIMIIKGSMTTTEELHKKNNASHIGVVKKRNSLLIDITDDIYSFYTKAIKDSTQCDFEDMILEGMKAVETGHVKLSYKYIIVDEYQDISKTRNRFVKAIQEKCNAKVTCVGDDWQGINAFAGSKLWLFTDFEELNQYSECRSIDQTFRYPQSVADVARRFISQNPKQLKKEVISKNSSSGGVFPVYGENMQGVLDAFKEKVLNIPSTNEKGEVTTVLLLARYGTDLDIYYSTGLLIKNTIKEGRKDKTKYTLTDNPSLDVDVKTIHSSKGLEADIVFILNNRDDYKGFPSKIVDDPLIALANGKVEDFKYAEERRIMYVALTRPKYKVYLLIDSSCKSVFILELEKRESWNDPFPARKKEICHKCGSEMIQKNNSQTGEAFLACSGFPKCRNAKSLNPKKSDFTRTRTRRRRNYYRTR